MEQYTLTARRAILTGTKHAALEISQGFQMLQKKMDGPLLGLGLNPGFQP